MHLQVSDPCAEMVAPLDDLVPEPVKDIVSVTKVRSVVACLLPRGLSRGACVPVILYIAMPFLTSGADTHIHARTHVVVVPDGLPRGPGGGHGGGRAHPLAREVEVLTFRLCHPVLRRTDSSFTRARMRTHARVCAAADRVRVHAVYRSFSFSPP